MLENAEALPLLCAQSVPQPDSNHGSIQRIDCVMCLQALWLRFAPGSDVVDSSTWQMYKLGRPISPSEVVFNGSQSMHAVTQEGVSVLSADHSERLYIRCIPHHPYW